MDEITLLAQEIPDEPPPSAETVARARARLIARQAAVRQPRPRRQWGWGWTAGAAVVTAGVVMTVVMLVSNLIGVPEPAPLAPPAPPPAFEEPPRAYKGLNRLSATTVPRSATKERLRFRPTSENIKIVIFCQEPGSVFFTNEGTSSAGGICGPDGGLSMLADKAHEPGWLGRDHQITVWVFPPDPAVARGRGSCPSKDACKGRYNLYNPKTADRLAAKLGKRPGAWSIAAYDASAAPTVSSVD
ncbi:hypothetical protein ACIBI9_13375 [Nonomuraea sp. NPDC050451]|uniref:hypothetical protein n=1 Tax=Nonomuraea sp. NPDC050451 TaxID=3364364 RepID=UPI00378C8510